MASVYPSFAHQWFEEVWNNDNEAAIDILSHPEANSQSITDFARTVKLDGRHEAFRFFRSAFFPIKFTIDDVIQQGDICSARWTVTMTHSGEGLGFAPTGRVVEFPGISYIETRGGKLFRSWNAFDFTRHLVELRKVSEARAIEAKN